MSSTNTSSPFGYEHKQPHRGALILTLGILGLVVCAFLAPVAWMMGSADLKEMDAGRMDDTGRGITQAGMICGIIGSVLLILSILAVAVVFCCGLGGALGGAGFEV